MGPPGSPQTVLLIILECTLFGDHVHLSSKVCNQGKVVEHSAWSAAAGHLNGLRCEMRYWLEKIVCAAMASTKTVQSKCSESSPDTGNHS